MIMFDTNVIVDLKETGSQWHRWSFEVVLQASLDMTPVVSAVVVGELAARTGTLAQVTDFLGGLRIHIAPLDAAGAFAAGRAHGAYRSAGGARESLLGDFLIGGHALSVGATLVTRDPKRYRHYFPDLTLITPEADHG